MSSTQAMTERRDKLVVASYTKIENIYSSLSQLLEYRQVIAQEILERDTSSEVDEYLWQTLEHANDIIKQLLGL